MAIGIQLAPRASLAFGIFGFASHAVIPKIFPIDLTKTFLTGIALNVGAHAMIHGIIPLMYMKAATVLYVAAQNLPAVKRLGYLFGNKKFDEARFLLQSTLMNTMKPFMEMMHPEDSALQMDEFMKFMSQMHSQSHHEPEDKVVDVTKNDNVDVTENEEVD